jgi:hypothetical protein
MSLLRRQPRQPSRQSKRQRSSRSCSRQCRTRSGPAWSRVWRDRAATSPVWRTSPRAWQTCPRIAIQVAAKFIVRRITRNEQMGDYIVAGPPSPFRFQPNDSRTVQFPAIFALRVDLVRSVRVDAQDSHLRRTHESAVKASRTPTPPAARALN